MRMLWKKCKSHLNVGESAPEPSFASGGWGLSRVVTPAPAYYYSLAYFSSFLVLNESYSLKKEQNSYSKLFCSCFLRTFATILHFKHLSFLLTEGARILLAPGRRVANSS